MDKRVINESLNRFSDIVKEEYAVKSIILYGSYARGSADEDSDIDLVVVVEEIDGDILAHKARLFTLRRDIDERIEPILIVESDESGFLEDILKYGEILYSNK
jgi:predicted nucleotidyltransferase